MSRREALALLAASAVAGAVLGAVAHLLEVGHRRWPRAVERRADPVGDLADHARARAEEAAVAEAIGITREAAERRRLGKGEA